MDTDEFKDRYVLAVGYPCAEDPGPFFVGLYQNRRHSEDKTDLVDLQFEFKCPEVFKARRVPKYRLVLERVR